MQQQATAFTLDNGQTFHQLPQSYQLYAHMYQRATNGDDSVNYKCFIILKN